MWHSRPPGYVRDTFGRCRVFSKAPESCTRCVRRARKFFATTVKQRLAMRAGHEGLRLTRRAQVTRLVTRLPATGCF